MDILHTLAQGDIDSTREYILGFGAWALRLNGYVKTNHSFHQPTSKKPISNE